MRGSAKRAPAIPQCRNACTSSLATSTAGWTLTARPCRTRLRWRLPSHATFGGWNHTLSLPRWRRTSQTRRKLRLPPRFQPCSPRRAGLRCEGGPFGFPLGRDYGPATSPEPGAGTIRTITSHMTNGLVLSIDGMGGDSAPDIVVEGVDIFARTHPDVRFLVHGDAARIGALMEKYAAAKAASEIVPAEKAIGMEVKASQALRQGKGSSLWNAVQAVEHGNAHAVVSAGNTGAYMAIAMFR